MNKDPLPDTLSEYLLAVSQGFQFYPNKIRRSERGRREQERLDDVRARFAEWRRTLIPTARQDDVFEWFNERTNLDELYCRESLKGVSRMVARTLQLPPATLSGIPDGPAFVYLREAARCYIQGLDQASIALARAALEAALKKRLGDTLGKDAVAREKLDTLIKEWAPRTRTLTAAQQKEARRIQVVANRVLHEKPTDERTAFEVLQAARGLVLHLSRK